MNPNQGFINADGLKEWNKLSVALKEGNKRVKWEDRIPYAYWKGNPKSMSIGEPLFGVHKFILIFFCGSMNSYEPVIVFFCIGEPEV